MVDNSKAESKEPLTSYKFSYCFFNCVTWRLLNVRDHSSNVCVILINIANTSFYNLGAISPILSYFILLCCSQIYENC
jgi:hypothetical protein